MMKMSFIKNFGAFPNKDIFIKFIIYLLGFNVAVFFEKREENHPKLRINFLGFYFYQKLC